MYTEFYQLTERPFNVTPDPKFLYLNARYREALASLNYGISQRKGFITLIGEAGTGKTTLLKKLLEDLDEKTKTVFIFNTNVSFEEILEYIFAEFDLPVHNGKKLYMLQRLNAFLLEELRNGGNVALLIDEAQDLEFSVLEDLRLLSNLETAKEKILQIVLTGQPELGQKLSNPGLRQLRQRIGINCRLLPLSRDEVTEYIDFRLQAAGAADLKLFTRDAEDEIHRLSRGIPRLVNVVCDNALVIAYAVGKKRIGADIVGEAAADLLPAEMATETGPGGAAIAPGAMGGTTSRPQDRWLRFGLGAALASAVAVGLWSVGRTTPDHTAETVARPLAAPGPQTESVRPASEARDLQVPPGPGTGRPLGANDRAPEAGAGKAADAPAVEARRAPEPPQEVAAAKQVPKAAADDKASAPAAAASAGADEPRAPTTSGSPPEPAEAVVAANEEQRSGSRPGRLRLDGANGARLVVQGGDSLSVIARRKYGQSSYTVLDLLKLANPEVDDVNVIAPGQTVRLPDLQEGFPILTDGAGSYSLLVFSTPNQTRAQNLAKALRGRGFNPDVTATSLSSSKRIFRVTVGGATSRDDAATIGRELQQVLREDARIVQLGE